MSRHMSARLDEFQPGQQFRVPVYQANPIDRLIPLGSSGSKTWVRRRIYLMRPLDNILRLGECRVPSGMVNVIVRRNDCINIVRL